MALTDWIGQAFEFAVGRQLRMAAAPHSSDTAAASAAAAGKEEAHQLQTVSGLDLAIQAYQQACLRAFFSSVLWKEVQALARVDVLRGCWSEGEGSNALPQPIPEYQYFDAAMGACKIVVHAAQQLPQVSTATSVIIKDPELLAHCKTQIKTLDPSFQPDQPVEQSDHVDTATANNQGKADKKVLALPQGQG